MSDAATRRKALNQIQAEIERFYRMSAEDRKDWASITMGEALRLLSVVCGPELMATAYGEPQSGGRGASLDTLSDRLGLSSLLFADLEQPGSGHAISDASLEAYLVARGDKPQLFAPIPSVQGKPDASFRVENLAPFPLRQSLRDCHLPETSSGRNVPFSE